MSVTHRNGVVEDEAAAIGVQDLAGHIGGILAGQKRGNAGNFLDLADAAERRSGQHRPHRVGVAQKRCGRSEEHTSELQSLMRISYAVFCLKKKKQSKTHDTIKIKTTTK